MPLLINQRRQADPTGTAGIRRRYEADVRRRFDRLRRDTWISVAINDAFGLAQQPRIFQPAPPRAFDFPTDPAKIAAFRRWLRQQIDDGILEVIVRNPDGTIDAITAWQDTYVRAAYGKGVADTQLELFRQGIDITQIELRTLLQGPVHVPRLEVLFTRNFTELEGITAAMDQAITRILADGLSRGDGPRTIASALTKQIDISRNRARLMARTEVIRAHAEGTLTELERQGIFEVRADVEFRTAGDIRVCPSCLLLEGRTFTTREARGIIPVHPRCRCRWLPANIGEDPRGRRERRLRARRRRRELATSLAARRAQREASRGAA